jgi:TRAP-type C4-dicarboxylate transport system substrate-binding protein
VIAPEGTPWARELNNFARDVEASTAGRVRVKWYFGGIAGDELEALERIKRGQLDGEAGATFCEHLAPSMRVTRIWGVLQSRGELSHVMKQLRPALDQEFATNGFVNLGLASFGRVILFTRRPVRTMEDLRGQRMWVWRSDDMGRKMFEGMGVRVVTTELNDAGQAYDERRHDGFSSIAIGALAFQWSSRTPYYSDMTLGMLPACLAVSQRAFNLLSQVDREALRAAGAKLSLRIDDAGDSQEDQLVEKLFEKQGLKRVRPTPQLRQEFLSAARAGRDKLEGIAPDLLERVLTWLADFRSEHR